MPEKKLKELPEGFYSDPVELSEITFEVSEFNQICAYKDGFLYGIVTTLSCLRTQISINAGKELNCLVCNKITMDKEA